MQRYGMRWHSVYGCHEILPDTDGEYVLHSEARAEIERLEREVERLKLAKLYDEKAKDRALLLERQVIADTVHNDAIEAAAEMLMRTPVPPHEVKAVISAASTVRTLKRSQE